VKSENASTEQNGAPIESPVVAGAAKPDLQDPRVVLSLLETDQVVAAKRQSRFGRRPLSPGIQMLLWGLRGYVVIMLVIVVIAVVRAMHPAP
jgi:hypothetical protein